MLHQVTAMNVRQNFGQLLNQVQYRQDSILITKSGHPVAALVDIHLFEKIRLMRQEFERLSTQFARAYQDVREAEGLHEIDEALKSIRKHKKREA